MSIKTYEIHNSYLQDAPDSTGITRMVSEADYLSQLQQTDALQTSMNNIINAFGISGEGAHSKLVIEYVHGLVAENARMREAIEFATAPDMWQEQHDGMLDYRYVDWYVDVLNAALEPKSTDAAIAELRAQGVDAFAESVAEMHSKTETGSRLEVQFAFTGDAAVSFAANLRAGRRG